ncbi:transposase [Serratia marcescens]
MRSALPLPEAASQVFLAVRPDTAVPVSTIISRPCSGEASPRRDHQLERTLYPGKKRSRSSTSPPLQTPITTVPSKSKRRGRRPNLPLAFKLALVEMQPGVSTARLAREHGINNNLLFNWRNLYKQGHLGTPLPVEPCLLPVELEDNDGRQVD